MNGPRITNEERGFTANKPAFFLGVVTICLTIAGGFLGTWSRFTELSVTVHDLKSAQERQAQDRRDTDVRLRALESNREGAAAEIVALRRDLSEVKSEQRLLATEMRQLTTAINQFLGQRTAP
jgi:hypothetical protein